MVLYHSGEMNGFLVAIINDITLDLLEPTCELLLFFVQIIKRNL